MGCLRQYEKTIRIMGKQILDLHHDNAQTHTSLSHTFLAKNDAIVIPQPPYSLDAMPTLYSVLFLQMKRTLKGHSATIEEIKSKQASELNAIWK